MTKYVVLSIMLCINNWGYGQTNYSHIKNRKVTLHTIDTLECLIYETRKARIYFNQYDIEQLIQKRTQSEHSDKQYQFLLDTLKLNQGQILVREDTIYNEWYYSQRTSAQINGTPLYAQQDKRDYLNEALMFIAADLMIEGKCLPYLKAEKKFYTKSIRLKRRKGLMGSRYLTFNVRGQTEIYSIITTFGE